MMPRRHLAKIRWAALAACCCNASAASAASATTDEEAEAKAQAVAELLSQRWYEIEMVVFERLPVLDLNSTEQLALRRARSWPRTLRLLDDTDPIEPTHADPDDTRWTLDDSHCFTPEPAFDSALPVPEFSDRNDREFQDLTGRGEEAEEDGFPIPLNDPRVQPTEQLRFIAELAEFEDFLANTSLQWLPTTALSQAVKAINRRNHLRPVLHVRWRQALPERDSPHPLMIATDITPQAPMTAEGFAKVEGYVAVTLGRYLHFAPTLWYHADGLGENPLPVLGTPLPATGLEPEGIPYMELKGSRRMRSGEIHYIDHPKLGIIVQIDPVAIPQTLIDSHQAFTQSGRQRVNDG